MFVILGYEFDSSSEPRLIFIPAHDDSATAVAKVLIELFESYKKVRVYKIESLEQQPMVVAVDWET